MKRWTIYTIAIAIALSTTAFVGAQQRAKKTMIVGEVIDVVDYTMKGWHGAEHAESGRYHAENGFPVAILEEETGEIYIATHKKSAPAAVMELANGLLIPFMGQKVVIQGHAYKADGINLVEVAIIGEY